MTVSYFTASDVGQQLARGWSKLAGRLWGHLEIIAGYGSVSFQKGIDADTMAKVTSVIAVGLDVDVRGGYFSQSDMQEAIELVHHPSSFITTFNLGPHTEGCNLSTIPSCEVLNMYTVGDIGFS